METQWALVLFTTFLAWSAGLFATQGVYALKGECGYAQKRSLLVSFILMVIGGVAVFFHLQHWERIFNGFGHITSGITQELIFIVVMFVVMVIFFVLLRRSDDGALPKWAAWLAIISAVVLVCVMGNSYVMASRPAWNSVFEILSLVGAACAMGPATFAAIADGMAGKSAAATAGSDDKEAKAASADESATKLHGTANVAGNVINTVTTVLYVAAMTASVSAFTQVGYFFDPYHPNEGLPDAASYSPFASGNIGVTIAALVFAVLALVLAIVAKKKGNWKGMGWIIALCVVVCALCLRVVFYACGGSVFMFY
jgi:DMSO reductase anchor subunit